MRYLTSLIELKNLTESVWEYLTKVQGYRFQVFVVLIVFLTVYRWRIGARLYLNYPRFKIKAIYCGPCFGFWLAFMLSGNVLTAATAFIIYSLYDN